MRLKNLMGFLLSFGLILAALFFQYYQHLNPCPLCILQRLAFMGVALLFLIFLIFPAKKWLIRLQAVLMFLVAGGGLAVAIRQVYLQHLPKDQVPGCGPGLNYLIQNLPLNDALLKIFQGSGECAVVDWRFLGLSMASWSAIWLAVFVVWAIKQFFYD
ncbi:MAG: disulfide bond formation protein DsbB [Gammaproteobacteria bacterium]|nr:disulfide bond formation protein DsbB [Gammaproteobacteria bacterium]